MVVNEIYSLHVVLVREPWRGSIPNVPDRWEQIYTEDHSFSSYFVFVRLAGCL